MKDHDEREHVFVVGSPRSGTSLLASILQMSPMYAEYRAETKLLAGCEEKYGNLDHQWVRERFWSDWFCSRQFMRSGLAREDVQPIADSRRSYFGILMDIMNLVATRQGRERWIDSTPENSGRLAEIAETFPNAKIVHVIRDGRAVSLSLAKLGWSGVKTENYRKALYYSSLKWQQSIYDVLRSCDLLGERYFELKYEDLVLEPERFVEQLCDFLQIPIVSERFIDEGFSKSNEDSKSTLHTPNTPFGDMSSGISARAAYRWKEVLLGDEVCKIEAHIGATLRSLGYPLLCQTKVSPSYDLVCSARQVLLRFKGSLKKHTWLGRLSASPFEFEEG